MTPETLVVLTDLIKTIGIIAFGFFGIHVIYRILRDC